MLNKLDMQDVFITTRYVLIVLSLLIELSECFSRRVVSD